MNPKKSGEKGRSRNVSYYYYYYYIPDWVPTGKPWNLELKLSPKKVGCTADGGGSVGRASTRDPKDEGSNPVRSTRKDLSEFFRVKMLC